MGHSKSLRFSEVREVFRLVGDVRDLRHDQPAQETRIVDGLCELIGAPLGWAAGFDGFRPGQATRIERFIPGTIRDENLLGLLAQWSQLSDQDLDQDPMVDLGRPSTEASDVVCRSERISHQSWSAYGAYEGLIVPSKAVDTMAMWIRYPGGDRIRGYALWRLNGEGEFEPRRVRLARLFVEELAHLHAEGKLEPPGVFDGLPERFRRLVPLLLTGLGQKQIAGQLGLSYHTVRSYVKELYSTLGVGSREELAALARGGTESGSS